MQIITESQLIILDRMGANLNDYIVERNGLISIQGNQVSKTLVEELLKDGAPNEILTNYKLLQEGLFTRLKDKLREKFAGLDEEKLHGYADIAQGAIGILSSLGELGYGAETGTISWWIGAGIDIVNGLIYLKRGKKLDAFLAFLSPITMGLSKALRLLGASEKILGLMRAGRTIGQVGQKIEGVRRARDITQGVGAMAMQNESIEDVVEKLVKILKKPTTRKAFERLLNFFTFKKIGINKEEMLDMYDDLLDAVEKYLDLNPDKVGVSG